MEKTALKQFVLTPSMGKRLIGKVIPEHPLILQVVEKATELIVRRGRAIAGKHRV